MCYTIKLALPCLNNTVCSEYLLLPTHSSEIVPPAWRVPNQRHLSPYPTSTGRSRKYSVRKPATKLPPSPSTCCLKLNSRKVGYIRCPSQSKAAIKEYIQEALRQGFIRPSTSPAASSFFFVSKKDGGLRLPYPELSNRQIPISSTSSSSCPGGTLWGSHLLQIGPGKCLQSHSYPSRRLVEDSLYHPYWPL